MGLRPEGGVQVSTSTGEQLRGVLPSARLGLTDYDLIVTDRRIVGAKVGTSGLAQAAGGLIGAVVSLGSQDSRRTAYAGMSVELILAVNKKNFEIPLASIERGEFNPGISRITMPTLALWVHGKKMRFMFTHSIWKKDEAQVGYAKDLLSAAFPGRIEFKRV